MRLTLCEIDIVLGEQSIPAVLVDLGVRTFLLRFANCLVEGEFVEPKESGGGDLKRLVLYQDGSGVAERSLCGEIALTWIATPLGPESMMEDSKMIHVFPLWEGGVAVRDAHENENPRHKNPTLRGLEHRIDERFDIVEKHVCGIPTLQQQLAEARAVPQQAAMELFRRIQGILTLQEQTVWRAVREAGGVQKDALTELKVAGIVNSEPTLSRMVKKIDEKLKKHDLPPCKASGPTMRYRKSGGFSADAVQEEPTELSIVNTEWTEDPDERERILKGFLATRDSVERDYFVKTFADIEAEAEEWMRMNNRKTGGKHRKTKL